MAKILIYNGIGTGQYGPKSTGDMLKSKYTVSYTTKITKEILNGVDVLVMPGGDGGRAYLQHFTDTEEKAMKDFVYNGGHFFGTCAGAYMAVSAVYGGDNGNELLYNSKGEGKYTDVKSLGITPSIKAEGVDYEGLLTIKMKDGSVKTLSHFNGPAMYVDQKGGGDILAWFNDTKTNFKSYGAIVEDTYGKGKVILCGPHPELSPQHPEIILYIINQLLNEVNKVVETNMDTAKDYEVKNADFNLMIKAVANYKGVPSKVYLRKDGVKTTNYVTLGKFNEMKSRWDTFIKINHKEPKWVLINKLPPTPVVDTTVGVIQNKIQTATGLKWKTFTEFYNLVVKYCVYSYYYDDKHTLNQEIQALINSFKGIDDGLNCVDYAQLAAKLGKEMGYDVTVYGIQCTSVGHAICLFKGKEFGTQGVWVDLAAAASEQYKLGTHWCSGSLQKEPGWIPYE